MIELAEALPEVQRELAREEFDDLGLLEEVPSATHADKPPQIEIRKLDICGPPEPEPPCVIEKLLPEKVVTVLIAGGGGFKTSLFIQMAIAIALGRPFSAAGLRVMQGSVAIVTNEDEFSEYRRRSQAALAALESLGFYDPKEIGPVLDENVHIIDLTSLGMRLTQADRSGNVSPTKLKSALLEKLRTIPNLRAAFFETASKLNGGDELQQSVSMLISVLRDIAADLGIAVAISHHMTKDGSRAGLSDGLAGRGSSVWRDDSRSVMVLTPYKSGAVLLTHARASRTATAPPTLWRPESFGHSVALVPAGVATAAAYREPQGQNAQLAYSIARDMLATVDSVAKAELIAAVAKGMPGNSRPRARARESCDGLIQKSFLFERDGAISLRFAKAEYAHTTRRVESASEPPPGDLSLGAGQRKPRSEITSCAPEKTAELQSDPERDSLSPDCVAQSKTTTAQPRTRQVRRATS